MKHATKVVISAFAILLITGGCASFRAPELQQDPAYLEQQRKDTEAPVSGGSQLAAEIVLTAWSILSQYSNR